MNEAFGSHRWHLILAIACRQNAFRVIGPTYDQYDTINADDHQLCDLKLLTGCGYTERGANVVRQIVRTTQPPLPVTVWKGTTLFPPACHLPN